MKPVYNIQDLRDWQEPNLRLAVLGDPVAHSASPAMHNAALEHLGLPDRYCRLHIFPEELEEAVQLLPKAGFRGVNLTLPHKSRILLLLDEIDERSQHLGAVNTVAFRDGKLRGTNTDGPGFMKAIEEEFGVFLSSQRILILGAGGGAGRAIAAQCRDCPALYLANRTEEKVFELARTLDATAIPWADDALKQVLPDVDLIVNTSSLGMKSGETFSLPPSLLTPQHLVYDTIYVGRRTPLQTVADQAGAKSANGLSMLLHQGVLALEFWLEKPVPVEIMRSALLDYIRNQTG